MHCYESEALRLQLFADAHAVMPDIAFDPWALEEVLDEFEVGGMQAYLALDPPRRAELANRAGRRLHRG